MPLYEYKCLQCGRVDEYLRKVDDRGLLPDCPDCNVGPLDDGEFEAVLMELQISAPSVSGWYHSTGFNLDPEGRRTR
ncbi:MAG: hypothetical protein BMS9Abin37_2047 [Acidobacteriota bacterium]|nr:MAG: hypothetical protein BMS9Abin37_2047 [Acidobacteriota bacterium]